ncbi:energy-coupling factor transporter transmembrane component T [Lachnoclostridium sp. Marseille-P6806]|uniref:energy-coupling factor transporter transmembrane component T n=1 Tax=Lachnoclostridium sp. Marseille-P6806 TaxID=2364793 RepID=UPI001F5FDFDD|nr:energy-coupling factor transporter transmembrane component T [Lachnoclostridium sp. Marseille-P6806]
MSRMVPGGGEKGLDPRTKLLLVFVEAALVLAVMGGDRLFWFRLAFTILPFLLLIAAKRYKTCLAGLAVLTATILLQIYVFPYSQGIIAAFLRVLVTLITRFLPAYMMGAYVIRTTKVSEFKAAMERMHVPDTLTIPMCVMFRFFPTVKEEWDSIRAAMRMRGIGLRGGGKQDRCWNIALFR